jgi:hypothetical protein
MANNLIRVKQLDQTELSGLVQNVIQSNEYTVTIGGTGININNVGLITISGTDINFIDGNINISSGLYVSNISGYTGQFQALFVKGQPVTTGSFATASTVFETGKNLYNYINALSGTLSNSGSVLYGYITQLSGDFDTSGSILNSYINNLSGDFNETGAFLYNYIQALSGTLSLSGAILNDRILNLSGDFNQTGALLNTYINNLSGVSVLRYGDQTVSGVKTFSNNIQVSGTGIFNSVDLNNIDILNLSGVDITITSGNVILTNPIVAPNIVYNTGDQTISGNKIFISSGVFSLSSANPLGLSNNPLSVVGSGNSYVQLNIQNRATGTSATADLVITSNNGTDTTNYINLGINNSGYNDPAFSNGSGLDGYLFINGGNLDIGTQTANTNIEFHVGGTTASNVTARLTSSGLNILSGNLTVGGNIINSGVADIFPASTVKRRYYPEGFLTSSSSTPIYQSIQYFPFLIKKDAINPRISVEVVTAGSTATPIRYGIYSGNNGFEGAKLFLSGSINAVNTIGIYNSDINATLVKGPYIIATSNTGVPAGSGPSTFRTFAANNSRSIFGDATGYATFSISTPYYYETGIDLLGTIGSGLITSTLQAPGPALTY